MPTILDYAMVSSEVYADVPGNTNGWTVGATRLKSADGELQAAVYTKGQETIVAFKGTSSGGWDKLADFKLGFCVNSSYFRKAEEFVARHAPNALLAGHSLGGAIAQVVGHRKNLPFVTFNAPGVALLPTFNSGSVGRNLSQLSPVGLLRVVGAAYGVARHPRQAKRDLCAIGNKSDGLNYRLSGDLVSQWGVHRGKVITVGGQGGPFEQHSLDNLTFQLMQTGITAQTFH